MNFPRSLRTRFTIQTGGAIVSLVVVFAIITILAVSLHLYDAAASDAYSVYSGLNQAHGETLVAIVHEYTRSVDPHIWIIHGHRILLHSPNAATHPTGPLTTGLSRNPFSFRLVKHSTFATYVVNWPLKPDLDLLGDLVLSMAIVGVAAAAGGVLLGRWTTHRVLEPVKTMTRDVEIMLSSNQFLPVDNPSRTNDEFSQLARLLSELVQTLEARWQRDRTLLADAAHQLRTPLEVIRGNLDILRNWDTIDRTTEEENLAAIDRAVSDMIALVGDLLTLEHVRNEGMAQLDVHPLQTLLEDACEDAKALDSSLQIVLQGQPQETVIVHEAFARRALWAVLENAVKYSPKGGRIEISVLTQGELCGISIRDYGPGIPAQDIPNIFTRFYRGQNGPGKSGTGLGLSIAEALMRSQKGHITVDTNDQGTTFTLWFLRGSSSSL